MKHRASNNRKEHVLMSYWIYSLIVGNCWMNFTAPVFKGHKMIDAQGQKGNLFSLIKGKEKSIISQFLWSYFFLLIFFFEETLNLKDKESERTERSTRHCLLHHSNYHPALTLPVQFSTVWCALMRTHFFVLSRNQLLPPRVPGFAIQWTNCQFSLPKG